MSPVLYVDSFLHLKTQRFIHLTPGELSVKQSSAQWYLKQQYKRLAHVHSAFL